MSETLFARRGLSLDRLRTLVLVQEAGSMSAAAPDSPSPQSKYSRQLRELAEFLGAEITELEGKRLRPTRFGERLAELARNQLRELEDLLAEAGAASCQFRIGAGESVLQWLVAPRLAPITVGKSRACFGLFNMRTSEAIHRVQDGRADFGIVRKDSVPRGLKSASLGCLKFNAFVPRAMTRGRAPTVENIVELPLATMTSDGRSQRACVARKRIPFSLLRSSVRRSRKYLVRLSQENLRG